MASFGFVCFAVMLATGAALEVTGRCPSGWTIFDETSSCYKVFTRKNFADAEQACVKVGAHLASVHSQNENSFLLEIAQSGYKGDDIDKVYLQSGTWIGLRTTDKDKAFQWTDSTKVDFTAWKSVEPNNRETEHCVELLADGSSSVSEWYRGWNNYVCNKVIRNFVCKKGLTAPVQRTEIKECPSQWKLFKGSCYKVGGKGNWEQAEAACEKDGAELVSIHSANENSFLITYEESVWIGMKLASDGAWKWSDGTKADYDAWAEGEPNFKEEGCGALGVDRYDKWNDRWNNLYCNRTLRAFVCKKTGNSVFVELD